MTQENNIENKEVNKEVSTEQKAPGRRPDFKGDGVAVWVNLDKNGNKYLAIKILGGLTVRAFPPKEVVLGP